LNRVLDPAQQQEQFSLAYVRAVVAAAGFAAYRPEVDDDSVDLVVASRCSGGTFRSPRLEMQLKCTSQEVLRGGEVRFPLKRKNYDDLRAMELLVPRILVVVLVPEQPADWIGQDEARLELRRCGYWSSLFGAAATDNETTVTVRGFLTCKSDPLLEQPT
jgi:hypothetical protein